MENYLYHRWPGAEEREAGLRARAALERRRRWVSGVWLGLFWAAIAALALSAALVWAAEHPGGAGNMPGGRDPETPVLSQETRLPPAEHGVDLRLEFVPTGEEPLTAAEIYPKVLPSVVLVEALGIEGMSTGTGVVLSADGYIITNYHVIEGSATARVSLLEGGGEYAASLVGYDAPTDIAVLKIDAQGLTPAAFVSSQELKVGDTAYAIGNPLGYLTGSMTDGIISATSRTLTVGGYSMTLIQTSAALSAGNSGGALVNDRGQVVGITSAKLNVPESSTEGLSLAIPSTVVRRVTNSILAHGELVTPALGILCYEVEDPAAGILIQEATPGGPAEAAGLEPGDIITAANGSPTHDLEALREVLDAAGIGGEVELTVLRGEETFTVTLTLVDQDTLE